MNHWMRAASFVFLVIFFAFPTVKGADRGWFGMGLKAEGTGFFPNPTIKSITIISVEPNSPAARGELAAGDEVIELEGRVLAGKKAKEIRPLAEKAVGESLHLRLRHQNGEVYSAILVAVSKPN